MTLFAALQAVTTVPLPKFDNSALEALVDRYNTWMGWATIAVATGILGEYVVHFLGKRFDFHKRLELIVEIVAAILVLGGVVGEYWCGNLEGTASKNLEIAARSQVAQLYSEAATATEVAGKANEKAAQANEQAEDAEAGAAIAKQNAADANLKAESERLDRLKLEKQLAPRRLDGDQMTALSKAFAPLKGKLVRVASYSMDIESEIVAMQIKGSLETAGATVLNDISAEVPTGNIEIGVIVAGSDFGLRRTVGFSLGDAIRQDVEERPLNDIPYGPMHFTRPSNPSGSPVVTIFVGRKSLTGN